VNSAVFRGRTNRYPTLAAAFDNVSDGMSRVHQQVQEDLI